MSVHLQISKQINNHIQAQENYKNLDNKREIAIESVLYKAQNGKKFDTLEINQITEEINEIAKRYNFPPRKLVTTEMIKQYLAKDS